VLSLQQPGTYAAIRGARTYEEANKINLEHADERRSLFSSVTRGVKVAISMGVADPKRIGITGLSDGTTTAQWALIHSNVFSAAAMSSCCMDPSVTFLGGLAWAKSSLGNGYPPETGRDQHVWRQLALSTNASRLHTPLLMQLSDDEYLGGLSTYEAFREEGIPEELYIFPGEHHVKWQPAHRLAIYQRNIEWFQRWLKPDRLPAHPMGGTGRALVTSSSP
jgi:dipeptidyl aminopeptidase/acylaminoacyl peptidase